MSYTYNVSTSSGMVRFLVGDKTMEKDIPVQGENYIFEDAEIDALLDLNSGEVWAASADACRRLAADEILGAVILKLQGFMLDKEEIPTHWMALADKYDAKAKAGDLVEFVDSFDHDISEFGEDDTEYVGDII